jgi:hypothetical protein
MTADCSLVINATLSQQGAAANKRGNVQFDTDNRAKQQTGMTLCEADEIARPG